MRVLRKHEDPASYRLRILSCILASQLMLLAVILWWPLAGNDIGEDIVYHTSGQEVIQLEEIQPTRQQARRPPPPTPALPVIVPDDVVLDREPVVDEPLLTLEEYGDDKELQEGLSTAGAPSFMAPEVGPKPLRFVEPEYTREARRNRIRAEVVVQVLVDEKGLVKEATILERFLLSASDDEKQIVQRLDYGLEEAALAAAQRWMFQPARQDGKPVRSYTTLTFSFGV